MKYRVYRTDTADALIRNIVLYIAENFGNEIALNKLDDLEKSILKLEENPYIGTDPRYTVLKRQGYKVLILEKELVFYKTDENQNVVTVYAVIDQTGLSEHYPGFMTFGRDPNGLSIGKPDSSFCHGG